MDKPILIIGAGTTDAVIALILAEHSLTIDEVMCVTPEEAHSMMIPEPLKLDPKVFE